MAAMKTEETVKPLVRELAVVLLTALSTNNWSGAAGDIVECESQEERGRLLDAQVCRELEEHEPERRQKIYHMADSHPIVVVPPVVKAEKKKAANENDKEDASKECVLATDDFFGADKLNVQVYKFAGGLYNVIDQEGKTLNEKKLRKAAVVILLNSLADTGAD